MEKDTPPYAITNNFPFLCQDVIIHVTS